MAVDRERLEQAVAEVLGALGEDPARPGLAETPALVAQSLAEFVVGLDEDPRTFLTERLPATEVSDLVMVTNVGFRSLCEHHLLPITGIAHIGYLPAAHVVGLGKLPRVLQSVAARPQIQERIGEMTADIIDSELQPRGVIVILDAEHQCVTARGGQHTSSRTVTIAARGTLTEPAARTEVLALIATTAETA